MSLIETLDTEALVRSLVVHTLWVLWYMVLKGALSLGMMEVCIHPVHLFPFIACCHTKAKIMRTVPSSNLCIFLEN